MQRILFLMLLIPAITLAQWTQLGNTINGTTAIDQLGISVQMNADGSSMIVGADRNSDSAIFSGQVKVFDWDGNNWLQRGQNLNGSFEGDIFGNTVGINASGDIIVVGAPQILNPNYLSGTTSKGYARVFEWNGTSWTQLGNDIEGENFDDTAGSAVSINETGDIIVLGSPSNDNVDNSSGQIRAFQWNGTTWNQLGQNIEGDANNDFLGSYVSLNSAGDILAVSTPGKDPQGAVSIYEWNGSNWSQLGNDILGDTISTFGQSINLDGLGNSISIGAFNFIDGALGACSVFEWNGTDWQQKGTTIVGDQGSDFLGQVNTLSKDGTTLAVSAYGNNAGFARIFKFMNGDWTQQGSDIIGNNDFDQFGRSISLSSNGSIVAIGTPFNDDIANDSGHMKVFENSSLSLVESQFTNFKIFPNPATNEINIQTNQNISEVKIYNSIGQEIIYINKTETFKTIDISDLPAGIYFINIKTEYGLGNQKFIKQ